MCFLNVFTAATDIGSVLLMMVLTVNRNLTSQNRKKENNIYSQKVFPHILLGSNVQNNWQIVNTNLSRYRSQSLQVLLDNAQGDSSQDSRTYKLQEEDFIFCLVRSIEEQARSIENRTCRIFSQPKEQLKPIKDQGSRSTSPTI